MSSRVAKLGRAIPDEPVLISLALVNCSPLWFLLFFLVGILVVTILELTWKDLQAKFSANWLVMFQ